MADNKYKNNKKKTTSSDILDSGARVPPHNLDMERATLCCALIDPAGFARIVDFVSAESFYELKHRLIYETMTNLFAEGSGIDALTVSEALDREGNLEKAGGASYIVGLTNEVTTSVYVEDYAKVVREKYSLRRIISTSTTLAMDAYDVAEPGEILDEALRQLFDIYTNRATGGFRALDSVLDETNDFLNKAKDKKGGLSGIGTGFPALDEMTSGFQKGDLAIIAARPSMGKTAFSLDLARHACLNYQMSVAYFSMEMSAMSIALRLLSSSAKINLHELRQGKLRSGQWKQLAMAIESLSDAKLYIDDTGSLGLTEMRARSRQLKQQHDIDIIFLDYMQLMKPPKAQSREQEVAQISRGLKGLARELEVPVVALSQLSRAVEQRGGDKRPQLSDLRDSGAIEQDADVVMFIYRAKQYKDGKPADSDDDDFEVDNSAEILIRKQRNGPTGVVNLTFVSEYAAFESAADKSAINAAKSFSRHALQAPEPDPDEFIPDVGGDDGDEDVPF